MSMKILRIVIHRDLWPSSWQHIIELNYCGLVLKCERKCTKSRGTVLKALCVTKVSVYCIKQRHVLYFVISYATILCVFYETIWARL